MDIKRELVKKPIWIKYWYLLPLIVFIVAALWAKTFLGDTSYVLDKTKIQIAKVEKGVFKVEVRAIGVLKPEEIVWISSKVAGRVEQIMVKPGSYVEAGDSLIKLSNPELIRDLDKARWELQATEAEMRASLVLLESQLLDLENSTDEAELNYQSTKLKLDAELELINQGGGSISKLDFQRTKLSVEQQKKRWFAQKKRTIKMNDNIHANKIAQKARLELAQSNFHRVKQQVEDLTVKSTMSGIVQQTSLELGQQANIGSSVATIANQNLLFAELYVQELQIRDIQVGQQVTVDTRSSELKGKVSRINPTVSKGMVQVDITLEGDLPEEARPELNVEGRIIINQIDNALFVKRPAFAPKNSKADLFLISDDQHFASKKSVQLGNSSVTHIQVLSGLKSGDSIITSDASKFQQHQQILLN